MAAKPLDLGRPRYVHFAPPPRGDLLGVRSPKRTLPPGGPFDILYCTLRTSPHVTGSGPISRTPLPTLTRGRGECLPTSFTPVAYGQPALYFPRGAIEVLCGEDARTSHAAGTERTYRQWCRSYWDRNAGQPFGNIRGCVVPVGRHGSCNLDIHHPPSPVPPEPLPAPAGCILLLVINRAVGGPPSSSTDLHCHQPASAQKGHLGLPPGGQSLLGLCADTLFMLKRAKRCHLFSRIFLGIKW